MRNSGNFSLAYLKRLSFHKNIALNRETLFSLQKAHLLSIPFENLDIHYGKEITLDLDAIFEKLISNHRGGFCYELNGLFYELLKELGFEVKLISGRVHTKNGEFGQEYDHLAIIATIDQRQYLVDVGFGKFSLAPLEIKKQLLLDDHFGQFLFQEMEDGYLSINMVNDGVLSPLYVFKTIKRDFSEFREMCRYHQTSIYSHFTKNRMISILRKDGRITLTDQQLKITTEGKEEILIFEPQEFEMKLQQYFNIKI